MVLGLIPDGVTGIFSDIFPSDCNMALGLTQSLVKMSTRNIPGGKGSQCVRLTTSPPSRAKCHEIWEPKPPGTLWDTPGLLQDSFTLHKFRHYMYWHVQWISCFPCPIWMPAAGVFTHTFLISWSVNIVWIQFRPCFSKFCLSTVEARPRFPMLALYILYLGWAECHNMCC